MKNIVGIIMGSDSDLPIMNDTVKILEEFGIANEVKVLSAHRAPDLVSEYAKSARNNGLKVIVAAAGGAAHLAGVTAAHTTLPVIGVPIKGNVEGLDALLATVQMPPGIPVATVAVNGAKNAGLLAIEILAVEDMELSKKLEEYKKSLQIQVEDKNKKLEELGVEKYLAEKMGK
ncbi:5-(carboxyamino)imidazole ribonucleotide mutase [Candidatus Daviesbacteria bacterium]|nr:5-(carboxyamino)imidazole ribonucleotide mutase [Candidatus Daviesbacteria bacterium]